MSLPGLTIKSARLRLAVTYLSIIMVLSLGFSLVFYYQSVNEAKSNLQRQAVQLGDFIYFATPEGLHSIQERQLDLFKSNLAKKLVGLNVGMLVLGGMVSLILARRSLRPLEEMLAAQSRFTSDAAHELRTPLTAIKTENEVALRDKKLSMKDAKAVLLSNLEEVAKLENLTSALLRLARSSEGAERSHWQTYQLADILKAAQERLADKAAARHISFELSVPAPVIYGDPDQLVELFVTLFGNAIKYSPKSSTVKVQSRQREDIVYVDIIDQGIGIAEVDLPHIFERFYRADAARSRSGAEGYGLGLSLAQAIAHTHGGKIRVKSEFGKGSTFTVLLPKPQ